MVLYLGTVLASEEKRPQARFYSFLFLIFDLGGESLLQAMFCVFDFAFWSLCQVGLFLLFGF